MKRYDNWFRADEGFRFVLTELGKMEVASYRDMTVGEPVSEYEDEATISFVEQGYLREERDPNYVELTGWKAVYNHKGYQLYAGNPIIYHDREMAELAAEEFNNRPWNNGDKAFVIKDIYRGQKPVPCRTFEGKTVYNRSYWTYNRPVGSLVEEEIVDDLMNCVPPLTMRSNCMQTSEPHNHKEDEKTGQVKATYATFKKVAEGIYEYCGDCFKGENEMRGKEIQYVA